MNSWSLKFFIVQFVILLSGYGFLSARSENFTFDSLAGISESLAYASALQNQEALVADFPDTVTGKEKHEIDESDAKGEEREEEEKLSSCKKQPGAGKHFAPSPFTLRPRTYLFSSHEIRLLDSYFSNTTRRHRCYILFQVFRI